MKIKHQHQHYEIEGETVFSNREVRDCYFDKLPQSASGKPTPVSRTIFSRNSPPMPRMILLQTSQTFTKDHILRYFGISSLQLHRERFCISPLWRRKGYGGGKQLLWPVTWQVRQSNKATHWDCKCVKGLDNSKAKTGCPFFNNVDIFDMHLLWQRNVSVFATFHLTVICVFLLRSW